MPVEKDILRNKITMNKVKDQAVGNVEIVLTDDNKLLCNFKTEEARREYQKKNKCLNMLENFTAGVAIQKKSIDLKDISNIVKMPHYIVEVLPIHKESFVNGYWSGIDKKLVQKYHCTCGEYFYNKNHLDDHIEKNK